MTTPTTFTARTPEDVLAAVPCLLGFRPTRSIVMLTFGPGRPFHARIDLPERPEQAPEVVGPLVHAVRTHRVARVLLVAYTADAELAGQVVGELEDALAAAGAEVCDVLRAEERRWFPMRPGHPQHLYAGVPHDPDSHPFTVQSVLEGRVTHGSRAELAATLEPGDPAAIEEVGAAALAAAERLGRRDTAAEATWIRTRLGRALRDEPLTHAEAGRLLVALLDLSLRDVAWLAMTRENAGRSVDLWRDVVRRSPTELLAAPAALLGFAAWLSGHGALAWCAVDRVGLADPDYSLAELLGRLLTGAVAPDAWDDLRVEIGPEAGDPDAAG